MILLPPGKQKARSFHRTILLGDDFVYTRKTKGKKLVARVYTYQVNGEIEKWDVGYLALLLL